MALPADIVFRDAAPGDESLVAHYVRRLADYEKLLHEAVATDEDFRLALFGDRPKLSALIVERAGEPIGFAVWFYDFSTFLGKPGLYLEDIFIEPEHRNLGLGREIFRILARRALAEGCARMNWSVLDWNAPSIAFYQAQGAQLMQDWTICRVTDQALWRLADEQPHDR